MALRRAQPGTGSSHAFLRRREWRDPTLDLPQLSTPFVIVGGVATRLYMVYRFTYDLDLLIRLSDAPRLARELEAAGSIHLGERTGGGTSWRLSDQSNLDVLALNEPWVDDAINFPNLSPTGLPVVTLPYLVVMKLTSSRPQDVADLSRMLGQADDPTRDQVREVVSRYRPEDLDDLESLIALGDLELVEPNANNEKPGSNEPER